MARYTLTQLALAAAGRHAGHPLEPMAPEAAFLLQQAQTLADEPRSLGELAREAIDVTSAPDALLVQYATAWRISPAELLCLALATAVERDLMVGRALAYLQAPLGGSRPTLGLLVALFGTLETETPLTPPLLVQRHVFACRMLVLGNENAPLPERPVEMPLPLCLAFDDEDGTWPGGAIAPVDDASGLPASVVTAGTHHAQALEQADPTALVLRSAAPEEARLAAGLVARGLNRRPFFVDHLHSAGLAPWLWLRSLVPVFTVELGPGETKPLPPIPGYAGPVLVVAGLEGSVADAERSIVTWTLPRPTPEERASLWREAVPLDGAASALARSHRLGSSRIRQLGRLAAYQARLDGQPGADVDTVHRLSRAGAGVTLDSLAQLVAEPVPDEAVVFGPELRRSLDQLLARCRHRGTLAERLGAAATTRYQTGVRALFVGPSGTGKTLAAGWLATRLGLPLYRIDLASITSKYIGETEKNLARLLARAEHTEAILLFDEADSLFGKRTDVRDANDRFANTQTNYLLQRLETFDSIALLTTNSRARIDSAFTRRLDVIIEFPPPSPGERRALWEAHLGHGHSLSTQELNLLAGQCDFAGGQIRNVVLTAAVAAHENGHVIDLAKILPALQGEYRKAGRSTPPALLRIS